MSKPKIPVPSEMQSHLLQEGGLEAAVDVLRWAQEENVKVRAKESVPQFAMLASQLLRLLQQQKPKLWTQFTCLRLLGQRRSFILERELKDERASFREYPSSS